MFFNCSVINTSRRMDQSADRPTQPWTTRASFHTSAHMYMYTYVLVPVPPPLPDIGARAHRVPPQRQRLRRAVRRPHFGHDPVAHAFLLQVLLAAGVEELLGHAASGGGVVQVVVRVGVGAARRRQGHAGVGHGWAAGGLAGWLAGLLAWLLACLLVRACAAVVLGVGGGDGNALVAYCVARSLAGMAERIEVHAWDGWMEEVRGY